MGKIAGEEKNKPEMGKELAERSSLLGESLEKIIEPLLEARSAKEKSEAHTFQLLCQNYAGQVIELLDPERDLSESRILVLENGTGILARRLADRDVDIISAAPTENTARLAERLNPFPNIIYKWLEPFPPEEEFDLVIDSGILTFYPPELVGELLPRLAAFCRRKLIVTFRLALPWYRRWRKLEKGCYLRSLESAVHRYSEEEITSLIETTCGMILTDRRESGRNLLVKAIKKPLQISLL
ncbi:MAG TPA: hypothetical protein VM123_02180 [archaeon]|nr:hypothetical protein [archaeon]